MIDPSNKLSETARAMLACAATRPDNLVRPPDLPKAAARQVVRSLLMRGLADEVSAPIEDAAYVWGRGEDGLASMLRATPLGLSRIAEAEAARTANARARMAETGTEIGAKPQAAETGLAAGSLLPPWRALAANLSPSIALVLPQGRAVSLDSDGAEANERVGGASAVPPQRPSRRDALRQAAQAVLDAWGEPDGRERDGAAASALADAIARLRTALAAGAPASIDNSARRNDTKQARVLAMLRRQDGASGPDIAAAMDWAPHTVRGFLAGLAKKGVRVDVLERVRQIGPNKTGAKGSFTVYRVVE
jgi:hypothetical protein